MPEMNVRDKCEAYAENLDDSVMVLVFFLFLSFGIVSLVTQLEAVEDQKKDENSPVNSTNESQNLSKYQRVFIDCPTKYLEACTKMSKQGTEQVNFIKEEKNTIHLGMEDNRKMIVRVPENQSQSTMIRTEEE